MSRSIRTRRAFLGATGSALALGPTALGVLAGRADPELEALAAALLSPDRDDCPAELAKRLRAGLAPDRAVAALAHFATGRAHSHQPLGVIAELRAAGGHLVARVRPGLVFWLLDYFKAWERRDGFGAPRVPLRGPLPAPAEAERVLHDAMRRLDRDAAERALVALSRDPSARRTYALLWQYGARDWSAVGHRAIAVAQTHRVLTAVGPELGERALRAACDGLFAVGATDGSQQSYPINRERAARIDDLPPDWRDRLGDDAATAQLVATMRTGAVSEACGLAFAQLKTGRSGAGEVQDAIHVAAAELIARHERADRLGQHPLHSLIAANALHYAFDRCTDEATQLLILLQGVAWVAEFTRVGLDLEELRDFAVTAAKPAPNDAAAAVATVLGTLQPVEGHPRFPAATRASQLRALPKAIAFARAFPKSTVLHRAVARQILTRAKADARYVEFPMAALGAAARVHPRWQPLSTGSVVHCLAPATAPTSKIYRAAAELL